MATVACDVGDVVRLSAEFRTLLGVLTNPTAVTMRVIGPTGVEVDPDPTPVNDSAGLYHHDLPITTAGVWRYRFAGTGAVVAAEEAKVFARSSGFGD